ncbi:glycerol acyltransferase [Aquincola sp. S2]|uniref:Glycerol acyltransferase n=1 Tax=Pseudaquabacterium terrae TaxID=2732868 RepID=A0ABX2EBX2_9BURK|nr:glycerol acyltransferase [Aquabacterium terrae]NRF65368.1 glycerol acyltransferase [Aquabacterium terrae]
MPSAAASPVDTLTEINIDDLFDAIGLAAWRRTPLRRLLRPPARRFADIAHEFDGEVAAHGLAEGSAWMLRRMSGGLEVRGLQHVPVHGPVCVLANHPGMTDTVALIASLGGRPDLRVIALDRPFLRALPAVARQLIFVPADDAPGRLAVVRRGVQHLKDGGALLTFPAARIEPDPAVFGARRALDALADWSASFAVFARLVPQTACVPALVSQVLDADAQRHPLTRLRRRPEDREKLAAALQVSITRYQRAKVRVSFGPALQVDAADTAALRAALLDRMARLVDEDGHR